MTTQVRIEAKAERGKYTQLVFDRLLEEITTVQRKPGEPLSKDVLAAEFGVSRQPVTEALNKLAGMGLVTIMPQVGTQVSWMSLEDALESCFLRSAVESAVVYDLASSPKREAVARLRGQLAHQLDAVARNDISVFHRLDDEFHHLLFELRGMPGLWNQTETARFHMVRVRRLGLPREGRLAVSYAEHLTIVDEIEAGRPRKAANSIAAHIQFNEGDMRRLQKEKPQYFL